MHRTLLRPVTQAVVSRSTLYTTQLATITTTPHKYAEEALARKATPHSTSQHPGQLISGSAHSTTPPSISKDIQSQRSIEQSPDNMQLYGAPQRPSAMELIAKIPVIEIDEPLAICDGGPGGHPREFIQLNTVKNEPATCKYCGLRYQMRHKHDHNHHAEPDRSGS